MYQSPPHPYPPGYGFHPPPTAAPRYSYTPHPGGSASKHQRRSSQQIPSSYSARVPPHAYVDPRYAAYYNTPLRNPEHVSSGFYHHPKGQTRYYRAPEMRSSGKQFRDDTRFRASWRYSYPDDVVSDEEELLYKEYAKYRAAADYYRYYYQGREYDSRKAEPKTPKANQSRPRRASHTADYRPQTTPPKASSSSKKKPPPERPQATEADRLRCKIPAGYSLKNWDPTEEPLTLLGSVFDANSLGKWVYDWTCYAYGNGAPMTDTAGDLWLLLIQLAGKNKRADERIDEIRQEENRELVEDFLESGERLWIRFNKLLKSCEAFMYREAQSKSGEKNPKRLGSDSGVAFVECMFGRDRELTATEKLMANVRLWSMRFDANVDAILRNPEA
jgi:hypothetical protein